MKRTIYLILILIYTTVINAFAQTVYNHDNLSVKLNIQKSFIDVTDTITISNQDMKVFYLNPNLNIYESNSELKKIDSGISYAKYEIRDHHKNDYIILKYKGVIANNKDGIQNITHKTLYESTTGIIFDKGIYLSGDTYWIPDFETADLKTFLIDVSINKDWLLTSQGNIINEEVKDSLKRYTFEMNKPTNQVCLIGNKWTKYSKTINKIDIHVYLINPDDALAQRYLGATSEYLDLYYKSIGEFPYSKFDVIENFWESGYGMPSFTLLGKRVMRFPWILNTSYPHELLHNYWGNSVYVDYEKGNWCEGITTYMADHLLKEKDGNGDIFRRAQLKKYTDYVTSDNDFAASRFKSKYDAASEAIGYSKVLMINHMLRIKYGTDTFLKSYADFYENHQFEIASFTDIQNSFEKITGENLDEFFKQWINSTGAPTIELNKVTLKKKKGKYALTFNIKQNGTKNPFHLSIPVFVYLSESKTIKRELLELNESIQSYSLTFNEEPIRIDIDPMFDVMRRLNAQEVPPTLSQILGSDKWTVILPKSSEAYFYYKNLAISWSNMYKQKGIEIELLNDNKIEEIPANCSVWILGAENRFAEKINLQETYGSLVDKEILAKIDSLNNNDVIVYTISNPENNNETIGYINGNNPVTIAQINMKLMHYSNFSYFGFEGQNLQNTLKGNFPVLESPMNYIISNKKSVDWSIYKFPEADIMCK